MFYTAVGDAFYFIYFLIVDLFINTSFKMFIKQVQDVHILL